MSLEEMLRHAPVYIYLRHNVYHCNWSPKTAGGVLVHGRGTGDTPFKAVAFAYQHATACGWKRP